MTYNPIISPLDIEISDDDFFLELGNLMKYYMEKNHLYSSWLKFSFNISENKHIDNIILSKKYHLLPFIPSSAFKYKKILNVSMQSITKIMKSSGTTNALQSEIFLDKQTSELMSKRLMLDTNLSIGAIRRPMFVIEDKSIFSNRSSFIARGAAIAGLLRYGKPIRFIVENNKIPPRNLDLLKKSLENDKILIVGTTINVWNYLLSNSDTPEIDLSNASLIHGGGWKRLQNLKIDNNEFKKALLKKFKLSKSINFFGMVEQLGTVSYECANGNFHLPSCSRFIVRDQYTGEAIPDGQEGIIQVNSLLPYSYPGASILTDDIGKIDNFHNCSCGNNNPIFTFTGRQKLAETRGCGS